MKHRKRDPGSGIPSSKSNISSAMRGRIPNIFNFLAMRNQQPEASTVSHSEQPTTSTTNTTATTQSPRSSDRIAAVLIIMDLKVHPLTPQLQHNPNVHDERVILKTSSPHLTLLLKQCKALLNNSRLNSTYLHE